MKLILILFILYPIQLISASNEKAIKKHSSNLSVHLQLDSSYDSYHVIKNGCEITRYDYRNDKLINSHIIYLAHAGRITEIKANVLDEYFDVKIENKRAARTWIDGNLILLESFRFYIDGYDTNEDDFGTPFKCDEECINHNKGKIYKSIKALKSLITLCQKEI